MGQAMPPYSKRPKWPFPEHGKLTAHPKRQWCKWIDGGTRYFGPWQNPDPGDEFAKAALKRYLAYMHAKAEQRPIQVDANDLTLHVAVNHYLTARNKDLQAGNLSAQQFTFYQEAGRLLLETCGRDKRVKDMGPPDFEFLRSKIPGGPVYVGNRIQLIRSIFKWVGEYYGIYPRYGGQFNKPPKREVRRARKPQLLFEPGEIRKLLKAASPALKCFILLGINCGFGQTDCAVLTITAVDLKNRVINVERSKTGVRRVCPLWPETAKAMKKYVRPNVANPQLFFYTRNGRPWVKMHVHRDEAGRIDRVTRNDPISLELRKLCNAQDIAPRGFYVLRHTFNTIAEGAADPNARKVIMGHAFDGMDDFYLHMDRQPEFMQRLQKVTDYVHAWLYG
jgi:integrase